MAARKVPPVDLSALNLPDGGTRPYRPKPADFRVIYLSIGWDGIEEHFQTNWRVIRRWIEEEGREGLIAERAAVVEAQRVESRSRRKRYVLGRTLTAVKPVPRKD
jgi:hypothetical protein